MGNKRPVKQHKFQKLFGGGPLDPPLFSCPPFTIPRSATGIQIKSGGATCSAFPRGCADSLVYVVRRIVDGGRSASYVRIHAPDY